MMKQAFILAALILCSSAVSFAQASTISKKDLSPAEIDRIIKKFTANEGDFRAALTNYVFNRSATVNIIGLGGQIAGTYRRDSFMQRAASKTPSLKRASNALNG